MKRLYTLLFAVLAIFAASQSVNAQFRYAVIAGGALNDLKFKQDLFAVDKTGGFQAGIQGELMFPGIGFGMDFALLYNQIGAKVNIGERKIWASQGFGKENLSIHYLQIPLHLRFKWTRMNGFEDYLAPFVYGGPDFGIHVGHNKIRGNEDAPNPFEYAGGDLGLTAGGGVELFRRWQLSVQYTWGMSYVVRTRLLDNFSAQNRQWSFRLAYMF